MKIPLPKRIRDWLDKRQSKTHVVFTHKEAKELLESDKVGKYDTVIVDENSRPIFAPVEKEKETKKCTGCGKKLPKTYSMELCSTCAAEQYGSKDSARAEEEDYEGNAELVRDKDGNLILKPVEHKVIKKKSHFRRKLIALIFILLVSSTVLTVIVQNIPTGSEYEQQYSVVAWVSLTDNLDEHLKSAMRFYTYENDSWIEREEHLWEENIIHHEFGNVPLGIKCMVRVSIVWGSWSNNPEYVPVDATLNSVFGYQIFSFQWQNYTINIECSGSAYQ